MGRLAWAGLAFTAALVLAVLGAGYLALQMAPRAVADRLTADTGRPWTVTGRARFSVLPDFAVTLDDVKAEVALAPGTSARFEAASVRVLGSPAELARGGAPKAVEVDRLRADVPAEWWRFVDVPAALQARPRADAAVPERVTVSGSTLSFSGPGSGSGSIGGLSGTMLVEDAPGERRFRIGMRASDADASIRFALAKAASPAEALPLEFQVNAPSLSSAPLTGRAALVTDGPLVTLSQLGGAVGTNAFSGAALVDFTAKPAVRLDLNLPSLQVSPGLVDGGSAWSLSPADLDALKAVDGRLRVRIDSAEFASVKLTAVVADIQVTDGAVTAQLSQAGLYEGRLTAAASLKAAGRELRHSLAVELQDVRSLPLLSDSADVRLLDGTLGATVNLQATGWSAQQVADAVTGEGRVVAKDGRFDTVDLPALARLAAAQLPNFTSRADAGRTAFDQLTARFKVAGRRIDVQDLDLTGPVVKAKGSGTVDIADKTLSIRIVSELVDLKGMASALNTLQVPIVIEGPWNAPRSRAEFGSTTGGSSGIGDLLRNPAIGGFLDGLMSSGRTAPGGPPAQPRP